MHTSGQKDDYSIDVKPKKNAHGRALIVTMACIASAAVLPSCSPSTETVSGQMFIVTQGRDNIKLALVEVVAIDENRLPEHFKMKREIAVEQKKTLLPKLQAAERDAKSAQETLTMMTALLDGVRNGEFSDAKLDSVEKIIQFRKLEKEMQEVQPVLKNAISSYKELQRKYDYYDSPTYYLSALPEPIIAGKTDADGKFTLTLPAGKFIVISSTSRKLTDSKTEEYNWAVRVGGASKTTPLLLSNDNLIETGCKDCLVLPKG